MTKRDIDTPALILDLDVVEENIRTMGEYFAARPQKLRPHFKTPKTVEIARRQLAAGANHVCMMPLRCDDVPLPDERALEAFSPR